MSTLFSVAVEKGSSFVSEFASGAKNLSDDAGFLERLGYGLKYTVIGMLVVFLVLFILWACCVLFSFVAKKFVKPETQQPEPVKAVSEQSDIITISGDFDVQLVSAGKNATDDEKLVAIISAAIAASRNEKDINFEIVSIKKI